MNNKTKGSTVKMAIILSLLLAILFACDRFEDDVLVVEEPLQLQESYTALPNTSLMVDFNQSLAVDQPVRIVTEVEPKKGTLTFMDQGLGLYEPNNDFLEGSDSFVIQILNEEGTEVLDSETITIVMGQSEEDLPCFNGALTDQLTVAVNQQGRVNVIQNDGYCEGETSGAIVNLNTEPLNGTAQLGELFEFLYQPDSGFIGRDDFIYDLTLIDQAGNEYKSRGLVVVNVVEQVTSCGDKLSDSLFVDYDHVIANDGLIIHRPFKSSCDSSYAEILEIITPSQFGQVDFSADEIIYRPNDLSTSFQELIEFSYSVGNLEALYLGDLMLIYQANDSARCTALPEAVDDYFDIDVNECYHSRSGCNELEILNNDLYCSDLANLNISIVMQPQSGYAWAEIDTSNNEDYYLSLILTDAAIPTPESDEIVYEICDQNGCSSATVIIQYHADTNGGDNVMDVSGLIDEDQVWTSDRIVKLHGPVFVTSGTTLAIEPGTIIKGVSGDDLDASVLVVAKGAAIEAMGTYEQPIIFTSEFDDISIGQVFGNNLSDEKGLWGGLIILGNAPVEGESNPSKIKGLPDSELSYYGGDDPFDNSGTLSYVSIRHTGTNIGEGNHANGLTLGGVGSGTLISNIEVYASLEDGLQFLGGNVEVSNVVASSVGDDALHTDQGWYGICENFILLNFGNHALELDGPESMTTVVVEDHILRNGTIYGRSLADELIDFDDVTNAALENLYIQHGDSTYSVVEDYYGQQVSTIEISLLTGISIEDAFQTGPEDFPIEEVIEVGLGENSVGADKNEMVWQWTISSYIEGGFN